MNSTSAPLQPGLWVRVLDRSYFRQIGVILEERAGFFGVRIKGESAVATLPGHVLRALSPSKEARQ